MGANTHHTQKVTSETRATLAVSLCAHRGVRRQRACIPCGSSLQYFSFHSQGVGHHMAANGVYESSQRRTDKTSQIKTYEIILLLLFPLHFCEMACIFQSVLLGTVWYQNPSVWFLLQDQGLIL